VLALNLPPPRIASRIALAVAGTLSLLEAVAVLAVSRALWALPFGPLEALLATRFHVDDLALVMFLAIGLVATCSTLIARYALGGGREQELRFANLLLLSIAGMNGVVLATDLFTLYVFLEITAVSSFVLIALERGRAAFEGAFKYLVLSAVATALILAGLALLLIVAGGTSFAEVSASLKGAGSSKLVLTSIALFLAGLAIKGGLVPFHGWLPDAYSAAPAPVSVLLAGIVTKTTGIYTLMRLVSSVFGASVAIERALLAIGVLSILVGAIAALGQRDLKRMLAWSSISQVGYIVLGLGAGSALGMAGAALHLFNHSVFKSLLFVNAAAVEREAGTTDMEQLGGIGARMPVTGTTSIIAMLSTAGVPPLSGFWSKLLIVVAVWRAGYPGYAATAILASVLTLAYFLLMQRRVFFGPLAPSCAGLQEARGWALVPAVVLAAITLALGLGLPWLFETFLLPVGSFL
jgi:multicomponent Na+:H+ antiporter subunit D